MLVRLMCMMSQTTGGHNWKGRKVKPNLLHAKCKQRRIASYKPRPRFTGLLIPLLKRKRIAGDTRLRGQRVPAAIVAT